MRLRERPLDSELSVHMEVSLHIHGISFLHTMSGFLPMGYCCLSHCNTLISWVDSEVAGISKVAYSVHVWGLARSLRNNQFDVTSSAEDDLGMLNLTFMENMVENANFFPPSGVQGRVACRTVRKSSFAWLCFALFCPVWRGCRKW